jgi:hypothetical protein
MLLQNVLFWKSIVKIEKSFLECTVCQYEIILAKIENLYLMYHSKI